MKDGLLESRQGRKELRRLASLAHDRDLTRALEALDAAFAEWREGKLEAYELNERIHDYHQGVQREIWTLYKRGNEGLAVARALALGLLEPAEVAPELAAALEPTARLFRPA